MKAKCVQSYETWFKITKDKEYDILADRGEDWLIIDDNELKCAIDK